MIGERNMNTRQGIHKAHAKTLDTQQLRDEFLVESIFEADSYTILTVISIAFCLVV